MNQISEYSVGDISVLHICKMQNAKRKSNIYHDHHHDHHLNLIHSILSLRLVMLGIGLTENAFWL